jgi:hypothetical protein
MKYLRIERSLERISHIVTASLSSGEKAGVRAD